MQNILTIPERVITMKDGKAFVDLPGETPGSRVEQEISVGLSDAITIAVTDGLEEGQKVLEKPIKTLEVR